MKQIHFLLIVAVVLAGGLWLFPTHDTYGYTQAQNFAVEWITTKAPSYRNGGSQLTLIGGRNAGNVDCHLCYEFTYAFETDVAHRMVLSFKGGELVSAVTDGTIDELSPVREAD